MVQKLMAMFSLYIQISGLWALYSLAIGLCSFIKNYIYRSLPFSFSDKLKGVEWALITGSTDGLGLRMAQELALAGRGVVILGRNKAKLDAVETWFKEQQLTKYRTVQMNLSDFKSVESLESTWRDLFDSLPPIDLFINNAAIGELSHMRDLDYTAATTLLDTNFISSVVVTNEYMKFLQRRRRQTCNVIYISSGSAYLKTGYFGQYAYGKHISSTHCNYVHYGCINKGVDSRMTVVYLGNVLTKMNNPLGAGLYKKSDREIESKLVPTFVTSTKAARHILWQSFGELEASGPPAHYLLNTMLRNPLVYSLVEGIVAQKVLKILTRKIALKNKQKS